MAVYLPLNVRYKIAFNWLIWFKATTTDIGLQVILAIANILSVDKHAHNRPMIWLAMSKIFMVLENKLYYMKTLLISEWVDEKLS